MTDLHQQEPFEQPEAIDEQHPASWRPPQWQLVTHAGVYDYDRKPLNPIVRVAMYLRGYRWRRNPVFSARARGRGF